MTHHEHRHHQHGNIDWEADYRNDNRGYVGGQPRFGGQGPRVQDQGEYGGSASGEGQGEYDGEGYSAQGQFSNQYGGPYGSGGYGQDYGRQAVGWQGRSDDQPSSGKGVGGNQGSMRDQGYRDEEQFGGWRGPQTGRYGPPYGRGGDDYGRAGFANAPGGWLPNAEQGWGNQGRTRGGSWDQYQNWEQGPSGRGHWGQGYSDQGQLGSQFRQGYGGPAYGGQSRSGGGTSVVYEEDWLIPGPHSGRGPQGYQRNDARIDEDICERLTQHGQIDATNIQVKVEGGEVTLTGTVESRQTKRMAENLLDSISGVRDAHNRLRIQQLGQAQQGQQDLAMEQGQMGQGTGQGSNGQSRDQPPPNETVKAGVSNS